MPTTGKRPALQLIQSSPSSDLKLPLFLLHFSALAVPFLSVDLHAVRSAAVEVEGTDRSELQTELGRRGDGLHASHHRPNQHQGTVGIHMRELCASTS